MNPWLPRTPSSTATKRVFCFPHAGCGANIFEPWPAEKDGVELLPVELPGRLTRYGDPMPNTFQELAAAVIKGLRPYLDTPFSLFGHCWSGLLAYEVALQLQEAGLPQPERLFISGQLAPQDGPAGRMLEMDDAELEQDLIETVKRAGNEPYPELLAVYTKILRTDVEVCRRYIVPDPTRLDCPITAIGWAEDTDVTPDQMSGWTKCGDTAFKVFSGEHGRFLEAPEELLRTLCGQPERVKPRVFHETPGLEDWRVLGEGACAFFRTGSLTAGARFAREISALFGDGEEHPDIDLRGDGVTVRLITSTDDFFGLTARHLELARRISDVAYELELTPDPSRVQTVQVTIDALVRADVVPFWRALLGYQNRAGSPEDLADPRRRGGPFYFQKMDEPRPQRNRVHVDVWVPYDQAEARIAAAIAAGGRLVNDDQAPGHWVLADQEGNEACVGVAGWPGAAQGNAQ